MKDFRLILTALVLVLHSISPAVRGEAMDAQGEGRRYSLLMPDVKPMKIGQRFLNLLRSLRSKEVSGPQQLTENISRDI
ncbi:hypothetical protein AVEN_154395-1 [Araneus ventricosus]|uniref:Corticotropin-releasing factor domain-containing protein n=1 Tax=Araneus ventricosus TaxID=182803 RepID=A0A4Y2LB59_ARAVE|nr:hypothetical protein AVEN_154395-1 [Araneus ventricosus]